jgi:tetratricopeptide (TPR) repeat protein
MTTNDERDFLLKSLDDLEQERADGNIDDDTYKLLHDDYTARAAAAIRDESVPDAPRASRGMRVATISGIVVFALVAAFGLSQAIGQRHPGQTPTGNSQITTDPCKQVASTYDATISCARFLVQNQDVTSAIEQFFAAEKLDPKQPEPPAYIGWLSALESQQTQDATLRKTLLTLAHQSIDRAIAVDPTYPDAHVFKGLLLLRFDGQPTQAVPELQKFLALAPQDHPMRNQVLQVLAQAQGSTTTTP